jgi:hypothetical protein
MDVSSGAIESFLDKYGGAIGNLVDHITGEDKSKYIYREKNSDECWYPPTCQALTTLTPILVTTPTEYNKTLGISDARDLVDSTFRDYRETDLPQIYQAMNGSGGYNSTTAQLLANDAYARASAKAAKDTLDNVSKYANIRQGDIQALSQLYSATRGSYTVNSIGGSGAGSMGGILGGLLGPVAGVIGGIFGS